MCCGRSKTTACQNPAPATDSTSPASEDMEKSTHKDRHEARLDRKEQRAMRKLDKHTDRLERKMDRFEFKLEKASMKFEKKIAEKAARHERKMGRQPGNGQVNSTASIFSMDSVSSSSSFSSSASSCQNDTTSDAKARFKWAIMDEIKARRNAGHNCCGDAPAHPRYHMHGQGCGMTKFASILSGYVLERAQERAEMRNKRPTAERANVAEENALDSAVGVEAAESEQEVASEPPPYTPLSSVRSEIIHEKEV